MAADKTFLGEIVAEIGGASVIEDGESEIGSGETRGQRGGVVTD
jgi:hypothetical protein